MRTLAAAVTVAALLLAGCGGGKDDRLAKAVDECVVAVDAPYARLSDEDQTLVLEGEGEKSRGIPIEYIICVFDALDMPQRIREAMNKTRALDGRQSDSFDGIDVSWSYHPNDGLNVLMAVTGK